MQDILQLFVFLLLTVLLSVPLGKYIYKVMIGEKIWLHRFLLPIEKFTYRTLGINPEEQMHATSYILSIFGVSLVSVIFLIVLQMTQFWLPLNPQGLRNVSWDLAFNTAVSFVTNTNWQAYAGETTMSNLTQMIGLAVQNFISPAVGIAVCFALMRGFILKRSQTIGNFWQDITRILLYVLLPLATVAAIFLISQGVVQSFNANIAYDSLESGIEHIIPLGPAASQIAIKMLGTNGGGFFGANGAFPLENPTVLSNFVQILMIIIIPAALCVTFGYAVKDKKEGRTLYIVMLIIFVLALTIAFFSERNLVPSFAGIIQNGNIEGKETMNGISGSVLWGIVTTAVSNGSVNAMHASFTPIAAMMLMFLMQLGEIIFGGAGSGLYGMLGFVILTVFIVGLMVGRTPEYLGKKIEPFDIRMVCLMVLIPPLVTLIGGAFIALNPALLDNFNNTGMHRFSELLYAVSSLGNNNGSSFAGFMANTSFMNVLGGLMMAISRFLPIVAVLYLAQNLAQKKQTPRSSGALSTNNMVFTTTVIIIILVIGALSFLPALALGPIAESLSTTVWGGF